MPQYSLSPDRLFDRPWRPGHPFRPKLGRFRRVGMVLLLAVLCAVIFTYGRLTDSERVRHMAEGYLSDLIGCRVKVGGATLSVFEGLRLDDVRVYVDDDPTLSGASRDGDGSTRPSSTTARSPHAAPDAEVFSARTFVIRYDYRSMLRGQLEATQIIAEKPHVLLTRDARRGSWNFRRIDPTRRARPGPTTTRPSMPHRVPELLLRSARVELSELRDGTRARLGYLAIDGQLTPEPTGERCDFVLQSRGVSDAVGALISGWVQLDTGQAFAEVRQLEFGGDLQSLLFEGPREWWARHELNGRVDTLKLDYVPGRGDEPARFSVSTALTDVNLAFPPEELMSGAEVRRRENTRGAVETIRSVCAIAGFPPPPAPGVPDHGERDVARSPGLAANDARSPDAAPIIPVSLAGSPAARSPAVSREPPPVDDEPPPAPPPPPVVGADRLTEFLVSRPLRLRHVAGSLAFDEAGVTIEGIQGRLEQNAFKITGHVDGYSPDAPIAMRITSAEGKDLIIPPDPKYVWSLPRDIRDIYQGLHPQGACRLRFDLTRRDEGGPLDCEGAVEIVDGSFLLKEFPYPLREVSGEVRFGRDRQNGWNWVSLRNIRGKGVAGGPNQNSAVTVDGWIGPIGPGVPDAGFNIRVVADDITSEPALVAALDPDVRQALRLFDAPGKGEYPQFRGRVVCDVVRPIGQDQRFTYNTDIHLTDAAGIMAGFPYPLRHVAGDLKVRDGYVDVVGVTMKRSNATMNVDGRVAFASPEEWTRARAAAARATPVPGAPRPSDDATPPRTDLRVVVRALPVDDDLLASLPADQRDWVRRMGVNGRIDVDGELTSRSAPAPVASASAASALGALASDAAPDDEPPINYDLWITLKDGTVRPQGGAFVAADVLGRLHLTPDYLQIVDVRGRRGAAELGGAGLITWPGGKSNVVLSAWAKNLLLEKALYDVLPEAAQQSWDEVQPLGTIDATVTYATPREGSGLAGTARRQGAAAPIVGGPVTGVIAVDLTRDPTFDAVGIGPVATLAPPEVPPGLHAKLRPRDLSVTLRTVPYRLDRVAGTIAVSPGMVRLKDVTGRHGKAALAVSGTGTTDDRPVWNLAVSGQNLLVDDELHRALPPSLAAICDSLKLSGTLGFTLPRLLYRTGDDASPGVATPARGSAPATSTGPAVTQPASPPPGVEISGAIYLVDAKLDAGVQLEDVNGAINIAEATVRDGHLDALKGDVSLDSLSMAARPVRVLKAQMIKPSGKSELRLADLQARIAGGDLAGQVTLAFPDDGPSRYTLGLVVRNADVRELGWESDQKIAGRLTASLSLEGSWDKVSERRGRGDVVVAGKDMYHIPLLLGLLQVTNLALPISAPFERGVARYSVEGQRVVFEHVELRSNNMLMSGDGNLDFGTRQVNMTFVTDNPGGFQVPFLQDLWRGAQHELLRIHVRGSIQEPKVQTSTMGTFTTTVDEVFKGEKGDTQRKGRK
jgi:hypothetical protein